MTYGLRAMRRPLMRDPRLLIDWTGGTPFPAGSYTRASDGATRGADGVWRQVAAGVPRTTWRRDASGLLVSATLSEPGTPNLVPGDRQKFEGWTTGSGATATVTQGYTIPGYSPPGEATHIQTSGGTVQSKLSLNLGTRDITGPETVSIVIFNIGANTMQVLVDGGPPSVNVPPGETKHVRSTKADGAQGTPRIIRLRSLGVDDPLEFLAYAPQMELTAYGTSPILDPTASSPNPTIRAADSLYLGLPAEIQTPGAALAIYSRCAVGASGLDVGNHPGVWSISNGTSSAPSLRLQLSSTSGQARLSHFNHQGINVGTGSAVATAGQLLETLSLIWADSAGLLTGRLIAAINRGPLSAADLPPLAPAAAWSAPRLYVGSRGTAPGVFEWERLRVWSGYIAGSDAARWAFARGEI